MAHKRNGKEARTRRKARADAREMTATQFHAYYMQLRPEERRLIHLNGAFEECMRCTNQKLIGTDCQSLPCKALREENSDFYDEVTEDSITIKGATMYAGVDY